MPLEIVAAGHEALRTPARPVAAGAEGLDQLVADMTDALRDAPGVGLAANQVGIPVRLALVEDRPEYHEGVGPELLAAQDRRPLPLEVLLNPTVEPVGDGTAAWFEGCLSVPGYAAVVPRATRVRLRAQDVDGRPVEYEATGWHARILQHEVDHLDGRLYVDRMLSRTFVTTEAYLDHWRGRSIEECKRILGA